MDGGDKIAPARQPGTPHAFAAAATRLHAGRAQVLSRADLPADLDTGTHEIEAIGPMSARVRLVYHPDHLRPGGTISGPSLFALADLALYVAILAQIGRVPLAVTTNLNINFLRKPAPGDVDRRGAADEAGQAAGGRRGRAPFGRRGGDGRPRDGDLFDPGARRRECGIIIPHRKNCRFSVGFRVFGVDASPARPL